MQLRNFLKKMLCNPDVTIPTVINVDKNPAFSPAHNELVKEKELPSSSKLKCIKYLNNIVENDHKSVKRKSRYRQWYQSFDTAAATITGIETMRQKGQIRRLAKNDIISQNKLINQLFGLAS